MAGIPLGKLSRHKNRGWQGQLARVRRWHKRISEIGRVRSRSRDMEGEHDFLYAFFQNCHYLRDWLIKSNAVSREKLNELYGVNTELQICRDICNGTKHFDVTSPSIDPEFAIGREYVPPDWPGDRPHVHETWFIIAGGRKYDLFELAHRCMELWEVFVADNKLEPSRPRRKAV